MARVRLTPEEQQKLIEEQKLKNLKKLQLRNQAGLLNPRQIRANPEVTSNSLLTAGNNNNMTPIPDGGLENMLLPVEDTLPNANTTYDAMINDPNLNKALKKVYSPTLGQRASGLLDKVSDAYMGAAPIFAVAQEFQKAGALRPVGGAMQGDPYGTMMQLQQNEQQLETLEKLRQNPQYAQFANLPNEQFIKSVEKQNEFVIENQLAAPNTYANIDTNVSSENLMAQLNETKKPIVLSDYELRSHGNAEMAHGIENTLALMAGSISVPFTSRNLAKKTEEARAATVDYFNEVRGILVDNVGGRVTVFDKKAVNNQLPAEFNADGSISSYSSEGEALAKYQGLRGALTGQLKDAIALTQDPNTRDDKTVMRKANSKIDKLRRAIRMTDVRIDSLNQERRGDDAFFGEREDLFENPTDTSGRSEMTEEQAAEIFLGDLDITFE